MPKQGFVMSEKESNMVVRSLDVMMKRMEKLKSRFQSSTQTAGVRSASKRKPRPARSRGTGASAPS